MKIKITHPIKDYQAGLVYDVPDKEAQELIKKDYAFEVADKEKFLLDDFGSLSKININEATEKAFKPKKVKNDNR